MQMRMFVRRHNTGNGNVNVHVHVHGNVTVTWNVRRSQVTANAFFRDILILMLILILILCRILSLLQYVSLHVKVSYFQLPYLSPSVAVSHFLWCKFCGSRTSVSGAVSRLGRVLALFRVVALFVPKKASTNGTPPCLCCEDSAVAHVSSSIASCWMNLDLNELLCSFQNSSRVACLPLDVFLQHQGQVCLVHSPSLSCHTLV